MNNIDKFNPTNYDKTRTDTINRTEINFGIGKATIGKHPLGVPTIDQVQIGDVTLGGTGIGTILGQNLGLDKRLTEDEQSEIIDAIDGISEKEQELLEDPITGPIIQLGTEILGQISGKGGLGIRGRSPIGGRGISGGKGRGKTGSKGASKGGVTGRGRGNDTIRDTKGGAKIIEVDDGWGLEENTGIGIGKPSESIGDSIKKPGDRPFGDDIDRPQEIGEDEENPVPPQDRPGAFPNYPDPFPGVNSEMIVWFAGAYYGNVCRRPLDDSSTLLEYGAADIVPYFGEKNIVDLMKDNRGNPIGHSTGTVYNPATDFWGMQLHPQPEGTPLYMNPNIKETTIFTYSAFRKPYSQWWWYWPGGRDAFITIPANTWYVYDGVWPRATNFGELMKNSPVQGWTSEFFNCFNSGNIIYTGKAISKAKVTGYWIADRANLNGIPSIDQINDPNYYPSNNSPLGVETDMGCECSNDSNARLSAQIQKIIDWGYMESSINVPDSILSKEGDTKGIFSFVDDNKIRELKSLADIFKWSLENLSGSIGGFGQRLEIDVAVLENGATVMKKQPIFIPDIATGLSQIILMLSSLQDDEMSLKRMIFNNMLESAMSRHQGIMTNHTLDAILDWLGGSVPIDEKKINVPSTFTIPEDSLMGALADNANSDEELDALMKPSEIKLAVNKYTGGDKGNTLTDNMRQLLEAVAIIKATNTVQYKKSASDADLLGIMKNLIAGYKLLKNQQESNFGDFIDQVEKGFSNSTGTTDPYGQPYDQRPLIRDLGELKDDVENPTPQ